MTTAATLSRQERMFTVYAAYGRVMMAAHSLERRLAALLVTRAADRRSSKEVFRAEQAKIDHLPLGLLIKRFISEFQPEEQLVEELDNMLYFRNDLAHRISDLVLRAAQRAQWEEKVLTELTDITEYFRETREMLEPYAAEWFAKHAVSEHELLTKALAMYPGIKRGS
jgi:hypothetical protein